MATTYADAGDRSVSLGRVFNRGFGTIGSNPLATLGIAFLFGALPSTFLTYFIQTLQSEDLDTLGVAAVVASLLSIVIGVVLSAVTQGALVRATIAHSEGRAVTFRESIFAGLRMALPLILMGLLSGFAILLGLFFLLVPGVMLYVMWSVAAPAMVEERLGPLAGLGRSRKLTSGARWKVLGITLIILAFYWMASAVVGVLGIAWYGDPTDVDLAGQQLSPAFLISNVVVQTFASAIWGVLITSLYVELRNWKDGPAADALAEVFG